MAHIEEYKEDLQGKVLQLKQILEQQKQISVTKIKYIEDKYQNIKEINVGLEVSGHEKNPTKTIIFSSQAILCINFIPPSVANKAFL